MAGFSIVDNVAPCGDFGYQGIITSKREKSK